MLVSEKEAAKKWCPQNRSMLALTTQEAIYETNRSGFKGGNERCLASRCMWWRWHTHDQAPSERLGFCGAAGPLVRT